MWELRADFFVDVACADPNSDAADVWGIQELTKWITPNQRGTRQS